MQLKLACTDQLAVALEDERVDGNAWLAPNNIRAERCSPIDASPFFKLSMPAWRAT